MSFPLVSVYVHVHIMEHGRCQCFLLVQCATRWEQQVGDGDYTFETSHTKVFKVIPFLKVDPGLKDLLADKPVAEQHWWCARSALTTTKALIGNSL
jgi:hypothetical protein